jgi:anti-sigma regulatory factor (Ser/Thr protein kinase)
VPLTSQLPLDASPRSAADARRWVGSICRQIEREDLIECAELGVSELVANAVLHGAQPIVVRVRGTASHPRVEVHDGSIEPPVPATADAVDPDDLLMTFGRGLSIVARSALAWGASIESDGKVVWFEPAPGMREDGVEAEWVVDRLSEVVADPVPESAVTVRLLGLDMALLAGLRLQYFELRRELRLLSMGHLSDYPLAADLTAMFVTFERQFPAEYHLQIKQALDAGVASADLEFRMLPEAVSIILTMGEMFDLADAFCRAERLLATARTPRQREFHTWQLNELVRQLSGQDATSWAGSSAANDAPSSSSASASSQVG